MALNQEGWPEHFPAVKRFERKPRIGSYIPLRASLSLQLEPRSVGISAASPRYIKSRAPSPTTRAGALGGRWTRDCTERICRCHTFSLSVFTASCVTAQGQTSDCNRAWPLQTTFGSSWPSKGPCSSSPKWLSANNSAFIKNSYKHCESTTTVSRG